jgi:hypothetical protein
LPKAGKHPGYSSLVLDLTNPSPTIGWHCKERQSFPERCRANLLSALAGIHQLTFGIPLQKIADIFASLLESAGTLILEQRFEPSNFS